VRALAEFELTYGTVAAARTVHGTPYSPPPSFSRLCCASSTLSSFTMPRFRA
jgi:hypothetical protein